MENQLTDEKKAAIKEKDKMRKRLQRSTKNLTSQQLKDKRDADRSRQARYRSRKRAEKGVVVKMGFKSKQAKGKAVKKVLKSLPGTPNRRTLVVESLVNSMTPNSRRRIFTPDSEGPGRPKLNDETVRMVESFYQDDANSRVLAGKKDVRSVNVGTGPKEKKRKRYLLDDIEMLHQSYNASHPENQVGRSKFFQLRPSWVIPVQQQSQEVCQCIYHENIDLICESLEKFARKKKLPLDFKSTRSADVIWTSTVCDKYNEDCVWRRCDKCGTFKVMNLFDLLLPYNDEMIDIYQWKSVLVKRKKKNIEEPSEEKDQDEHQEEEENEIEAEEERENQDEGESKNSKKDKDKAKVTQKTPERITIEESLRKLQNQLEFFSIHNHTNITQLHKFKCIKDALGEGEIIISEDFSENYALKQQNEIMTVHWSNESLTLFCATVHFKEGGKKKFRHYVMVSDDLKHDKNSIWYYNGLIIEDVKERGICMDKMVNYWSDGPSSQFKNQYLFTNILFHEEDNGTPAGLF